jgi:molybdate transport system permease protein
MQNSFESINPDYIDAARTMGCSAWKRFWLVLLPSARAGVVTGAVLAFAHTVGEFGVVLMVGGSIPGETKVASIAIYEHVETLEYAQAAAMAMVLLVFSFVVLSIVYYYNRRAVRMTGRMLG